MNDQPLVKASTAWADKLFARSGPLVEEFADVLLRTSPIVKGQTM